MSDNPSLELDDDGPGGDEEPAGVDSEYGDTDSTDDLGAVESRVSTTAGNSEVEEEASSSDTTSLDSGDEGVNVGAIQTDGEIEKILAEHGGDSLLTVPGTGYEDFPYALKRTGSAEKRHYDRDVSVNFKIFDGTHQQIVALEAYLNEVVYPDQKIIRTDIFNAALLVGIYNPEQIIQVFDAWGFGHLSD